MSGKAMPKPTSWAFDSRALSAMSCDSTYMPDNRQLRTCSLIRGFRLAPIGWLQAPHLLHYRRRLRCVTANLLLRCQSWRYREPATVMCVEKIPECRNFYFCQSKCARSRKCQSVAHGVAPFGSRYAKSRLIVNLFRNSLKTLQAATGCLYKSSVT
jgi:hypothetical protein